MEEKWISYFFVVLVYVLIVVSDWFAAVIFVCLMVEIVGLVNKKWMLMMIEIVLIADLVVKSRFFPMIN
jgi:hypothetical protein